MIHKIVALFLLLLFISPVLSLSYAAEKKKEVNPKTVELYTRLKPYFAKIKELQKKDATRNLTVNKAIKEGNVAKLIGLFRDLALLRQEEIKVSCSILKELCRKNAVCEKKIESLLETGTRLQSQFTDMRVGMANRPLESNESLGILRIGTDLQKAYMTALLDSIRYILIANRDAKQAENEFPEILSLKDFPELADIPLLPPPPHLRDSLP